MLKIVRLWYIYGVMRYRVIDHTSDIGVRIYGTNLSELFKNSTAAFFSLLLAKGKIETRFEEKIIVSAGDRQQFL